MQLDFINVVRRNGNLKKRYCDLEFIIYLLNIGNIDFKNVIVYGFKVLN